MYRAVKRDPSEVNDGPLKEAKENAKTKEEAIEGNEERCKKAEEEKEEEIKRCRDPSDFHGFFAVSSNPLKVVFFWPRRTNSAVRCVAA